MDRVSISVNQLQRQRELYRWVRFQNLQSLGSDANFRCIVRDIRRTRFLTDFVFCSWRIGSSGQEAGNERASREAKIIIDDRRSALFG